MEAMKEMCLLGGMVRVPGCMEGDMRTLAKEARGRAENSMR